MERQTPVRNWKYVHHNRKQSEDSLDNSIDSVQSSGSGKFNRFQFRKEERAPLPFRESKEPIFVFTGKSRERNNDKSLLSKNSLRDKDSDTSKLSDNELVLKGPTSHAHRTDRDILVRGEGRGETREGKADQQEGLLLHPDTLSSQNVKEILRQVKGITEQFKKVIGLFSKKYRDMRYEWDRSFKSLLASQLAQESQTVSELQAQLERKQEELDQLSKVSFERQSLPAVTASAVKPAETSRAINGNSSFERLAISKVDPPRETDTLSRNNTIADFLATEAMRDREERPPGLELRNLRQTIKRMQQILDE